MLPRSYHPPQPPLFRPEVTTAQGQLSLGAIRLSQPISSTLAAGIALGLAAIFIAFGALGSTTRKARVTGITVPLGGSINVAASNAGVIVHSLATEGQIVVAGQPLFEISTERQSGHGEITELIAQQLYSRKQSLENERRSRMAAFAEKNQALADKRTNLASETIQLEQEIALAERRNGLAQSSLNKYQTLRANGYVSDLQVQQKQEEVIDSASKLSGLKRTRLQMQANAIAIAAEHKTSSTTLATEQAQLNGALASLQQEIAENGNRRASIVVAPQAGTVTAITLQQGQAVTGGQVLATIIPTSEEKSQLEAHLYAPSQAAGFVEVGQKVLIRFQAFPYEKFGLQHGSITDVSKTPFAPSELPVSLASTILSNAQRNGQVSKGNEAMYRIKVKLDHQSISAYGKMQEIKPGMTLDADVIQDRRRIWEWLLEPALATLQR